MRITSGVFHEITFCLPPFPLDIDQAQLAQLVDVVVDHLPVAAYEAGDLALRDALALADLLKDALLYRGESYSGRFLPVRGVEALVFALAA